jgi:hypothetical protein
MATLDFLFQGQPPPSVTTYGTATTGIPQFLSDYTQGLLSKANAVAGEPYQTYGAPRIADFTGAQQQAFQNTAAMQGQWTPSIQGAQNLTQQAAGSDPSAAASGYMASAYGMNPLGSASPYFGQAAGMNPVGAASGMVNQAAGMNPLGQASPYFGQAAGMSGINAASGYLNSAGNMNPLGASSPFYQNAMGVDALGQASPFMYGAANMNAAGMAQPYTNAASQTFTGSTPSQYMSPYIQGVLDRLGQQAGQNLSENIMPAIGDQFVKNGQFGSSRMQEITGRAMRDTQDALLGQQANVLNQGYQQAGQLFGQDQSRMAQLAGQQGQLGLGMQQNLGQIGSQLGALAGNQANLYANIGSQFGNQALQAQQNLGQLGSTAGQLTNQQASLLAQMGANAGNLSAQQMQQLGQLGLGMGNLTQNQMGALTQLGSAAGSLANSQMGQYGNLAQLAGNLSNMGAQTDLQAANQMGQLGQLGQTLGLRDAAALEATGTTQQNLDQQNLNMAYQDFLTQQQYPQTQLNFLSSMLRGIPYSTTTQSSNTGPAQAYQPSGLSQIAGALSLYSALQGKTT